MRLDRQRLVENSLTRANHMLRARVPGSSELGIGARILVTAIAHALADAIEESQVKPERRRARMARKRRRGWA